MKLENLSCKECNISFPKTQSEYKRQLNKGRINFFCSLSCGAKYQRREEYEKSIEKYNNTPKLCGVCNTPLIYKVHKIQKYCSIKCSAKINNANLAKFSQCKYCNLNIEREKKFCNHICKSKYLHNQRLDNIKHGIYKYNPIFIKKTLIEERTHRCEQCQLSTWNENKINLTLHHIDGDAFNNTIDNLQLLCWNCHSMTPNYGNKQNRRSSRGNRYKL